MQNSGYSKKSNSVISIYVDGNTAIKIEKEQPAKKSSRVKTIREQRLEGIRQRERARAQKKAKAMAYAAVCAAAALVISAMILLVCSMITYNTLTSEVESLTSELEELTLQNDSIEYEIDSSVDLNEIIETATEDLGMVRSTASQIVTYSDTDSEYVNQVAEIPAD